MIKQIIMLTTAAVFAAAGLTGCGGRDVAESEPGIEEIQAAEGIPVTVDTVGEENFTKYSIFTSTLAGAIEASPSAVLSGEVSDVFVRVGDYVERDQIILSYPEDNPGLNYNKARLAYTSASTSFKRMSSLYESNGISRQDYDNARTQLEIAESDWQSVQDIQSVKSPISGFITRLNVHDSDNVNPGDPLYTVSNYEKLKSTIWITDDEIENIRPGQKASAEWQGITLYGQIVQVDMAMDDERKAFAAKCEFDNDGQLVPSGVTGVVSVAVYTNESCIVIERKHLEKDAGGEFVYLIRGEQPVKQYVTVGMRCGLSMEIVDGLKSGDVLVTGGAKMIDEGDKIKIVGDSKRLVQAN